MYGYKVYPDQEELGEPVAFFVMTDTPYEIFKRMKAFGTDIVTCYSNCGDIKSGEVEVIESGPACFVTSVNVQAKPGIVARRSSMR